MLDMVEIGRRIKETRESQNISAVELAEATGLNKATIHRYERGTFKSYKTSTIESIANALNTSVDYLTGKTDDRHNTTNLVALSDKDNKEIKDILSLTTELLKQDGLMFDGIPANEESIRSIIEAMELGLEMAKRRNKDKYNPNKNKK